ncbi:MAG: hypothetical protein JSU87_08925 [Gemmatimonadota bacterium]|nr:MAG: hypothetical protein JSU87_08925 [Gemmatimonadota bacterium]
MPYSDEQLARMYAPIIRHEICDEAPHRDFLVRFDFDRIPGRDAGEGWAWRNPAKATHIGLLDPGNPATQKVERYDVGCTITDNAGVSYELDLRGHVYYSVVRTRTHNYITYFWYHPSDWKNIGSHDNDMEGAMVVAGTEGGPVAVVAAIEHSDLNAGRVDRQGRPLTSSHQRENEVQLWPGDLKRTTLHVECKGHGVWLNGFNRHGENSWTGTLEYHPEEMLPDAHKRPPLVDEAANEYGDRGKTILRSYSLEPTYEPDTELGLWNQFKKLGAEGGLGMNPPWLWTHRGDFCDPGEWFLDPAFYYAYRRDGLGLKYGGLNLRDQVKSGVWALRYTSNPFLEYKLSDEAKQRGTAFQPEREARMIDKIIAKQAQRKGEYFE